jgi:hypothetical protein
MQYDITLPADYDMGIIRRRVSDRGRVFDDRAGLGMKAFLIRERGVDGSPVNQYAPFYLWREIGAMGHFLVGGGGFQAIVQDFGRPPVRHWAGLATVAGEAQATPPKAASRRILPADRIETEIEDLLAMAKRDDVHTAALAIDPYHWQLVKFILWSDTVPADEETTERYQVLHLSAPGLTALPNGRHWD